jgi:hypothetical protein
MHLSKCDVFRNIFIKIKIYILINDKNTTARIYLPSLWIFKNNYGTSTL